MIIVDVHEPESIIKSLQKLGVETRVESLDAGDYIIVAKSPFIIERKTWFDLMPSWFSGRLQEQIIKMKQTKINDKAPNVAVIVEGSLGQYFRMRSVSESVVAGIIASLALSWNVTLVPSNNQYITSLILRSMHNQAEKEEDDEVHVHLPAAVKDSPVQLQMLCCIPKIGVKTAEKILFKYNSIESLVHASLDDLILYIGKKAANAVYSALHEPAAQPKQSPS